MSTKKTGVSSYDKAEDNEELFVLRAKDISSPKVIIEWIKINFETASDAKLRDAFECALRMRSYVPRFPVS